MNASQLLSRAVLAGFVVTSACDGQSPNSADAAKAAATAKELKAAPDDAEEILKKHGMTEQSFEELMFEIAEDPEKSKAFSEASP